MRVSDATATLPADLERATYLVRQLLAENERLKQDNAALRDVIAALHADLAMALVNAK